MNIVKTLLRPLPVLMLAAGLCADIASARGFSMCAEHNPTTREMTLNFSNGCVSSSYRYLGHDIEADINQIHASIRITGGFNYEPLQHGRGIKKDCGGRRSHTITVPDTEARRYYVSHNDEHAGLIDLTAETGRVCAKPVSAGALHERNLMQGWKSVDPAKWSPKSAASLMDVVAPIYAGHPETSEGRPSLKIELAPWPGQPAMQVRITMTGYLDDSVSGEQFVARVEEGADGWVLKKLWNRYLCARGMHAGQWTAELCS